MEMKTSIRKGIGFGLTSGVITTLGLIVGLNSSTHSRMVVIGGILIIAIADAMSDALGIHISEESAKKRTNQIWESTITTFITKFLVAMSFAIPVLFFNLSTAIMISIAWGLMLIALFSYNIAKREKADPKKVIGEHVLITIIVIIVTQYVGQLARIIG